MGDQPAQRLWRKRNRAARPERLPRPLAFPNSQGQDWRLQLHANFSYELWTRRYPSSCLASSGSSALLSAATCSVTNDQRWSLPWR